MEGTGGRGAGLDGAEIDGAGIYVHIPFCRRKCRYCDFLSAPGSDEDIREYFPEFMPYWNGCRFHGCLHVSEPDCLVKQAVEEGNISPERYASYCRMVQEAKERKRF